MQQTSLDAVINTIHKKWGHRILQSAQDLNTTQELFTTGHDLLDQLIGGLPYRQITQFTNRPTAGGMTLTLNLMAKAQNHNQSVVLMDTGTSFDGGYACACGVDIEDMVLVEVDSETMSLDVLIDIVRSQLVDLLILNFMSLHTLQLDWRKILPTLWQSNCIIVVLTRPRITLSVANLRLHIVRQHWLRHAGDITGCVSRIEVERHPHQPTGDSISLPISFGNGYRHDLYPHP